MAAKRSYRTHKGPVFSEGSRLAWLAVQRDPGGRPSIARRLSMASGDLAPHLYGDKRPGLENAKAFRDVLRIPMDAWLMDPKEDFELPACVPPEDSAVRLAKPRARARKEKAG